ncbi:MAG: hypothetical protein R3C05_17080 [Pirellulaceae bacterium]
MNIFKRIAGKTDRAFIPNCKCILALGIVSLLQIAAIAQTRQRETTRGTYQSPVLQSGQNGQRGQSKGFQLASLPPNDVSLPNNGRTGSCTSRELRRH